MSKGTIVALGLLQVLGLAWPMLDQALKSPMLVSKRESSDRQGIGSSLFPALAKGVGFCAGLSPL
jgi:hypothetical protein